MTATPSGLARCGRHHLKPVEFESDGEMITALMCAMHGPFCVRHAPLDAGVAPTFQLRMLDIIAPPAGACHNCVPRRIPAAFEIWETLLDPGDWGEESGAHSIRRELCVHCSLNAKADELTTIVKVRSVD